MRGRGGRRLLDHDAVARWRAARAPQPAESAPPDPTPTAGPAPGDAARLPSKQTLVHAELARKVTVARMNEMALTAEKGLKDQGLDKLIRAAQSHADLLEYTKRVMELVGTGAMTSERGRTLTGLVAQAARHMKARSEAEGDDDPDVLVLATEEGTRLVATFEGIVSDARRAELIALVEAAAAKDREENWNADLAAHVEQEPDLTPPSDEEEA